MENNQAEEQIAKNTKRTAQELHRRGGQNGMKAYTCGILAIIMGPTGLIGIAMAIIAIITAGKERGSDMAETGRFLGIVGLIIAGISFILVIIGIISIVGVLNSISGLMSGNSSW